MMVRRRLHLRSPTAPATGISRIARSAVGGLAVALFASGCATYTDRMQSATEAVQAGAYVDSLKDLNKALKVDSAEELPNRWRSTDALTVLERAIVLQSLGQFKDSSRDLSAAEQEIELLDLRRNGVDALAKYLYSDSGGKYKAPPSERLALNAINLLNYLADSDLNGAAVEARRFQAQREFLSTQGIEAPGPASLGSYLAGCVFEKLGEGDRALRYYEEALAGSGMLASLRDPVARLYSAERRRFGSEPSYLVLPHLSVGVRPEGCEPALHQVLHRRIGTSLAPAGPRHERRARPPQVGEGLLLAQESNGIDQVCAAHVSFAEVVRDS